MIHILLAAYNEEAALGEVLNGIARTLADGRYLVWIVDDGSADATRRVAEDWSRRMPIQILPHAVNQGLGRALQTGIAAVLPRIADGDVLATLDADNTHPPNLIPRLADPLEAGEADLAIASRFVAGAEVVGVPRFRRITAVAASWLFRVWLPIPGVRDYTCGFRAYRGDLLKRAAERWGNLVTEPGFAATAEWLVKIGALRPRVREVPLILRYDRKPTASKMPVFRTIGRTLGMMVRLRRLLS